MSECSGCDLFKAEEERHARGTMYVTGALDINQKKPMKSLPAKPSSGGYWMDHAVHLQWGL